MAAMATAIAVPLLGPNKVNLQAKPYYQRKYLVQFPKMQLQTSESAKQQSLQRFSAILF